MESVGAWMSELERSLAQTADAGRAEGEKRYHKSELEHVGSGMPAIRKIAGAFVRAHELDAEGLRKLVDRCFKTRVFELRSVAIAVLEKRRKLLSPQDSEWLVSLVRASPMWAHVDWLATAVIGPVLGESVAAQRLLDRWARDEDVWVRRTAILAPLVALRSGEGDFEAFERRVAPLLEEKVFWIRKAIGWVLREVSKKRPELVSGFVDRHREEMSGLTYREATKYL